MPELLYKNICENKDFGNVMVPSEDSKILEFNQCHKSEKALFIIYADLECIIKKTDGCNNNSENSSTAKISIRSTLTSFRSIEKKHDVYRGRDSWRGR